MAECLGSHDDFGKLWRASGRDHMASCIPIIIHEDGVPHFSGIWACMHQLRSFWSWSTGCLRNDSWKSRHAIAIMGTSQVTEETRREICKIVAWDMKQLEAGVYDVVNHTGRFHPLGSKREKLAGEKFSMKAVARLFKMIGEPPNELAQVQSSDVFMRHITNAIYSTCRV